MIQYFSQKKIEFNAINSVGVFIVHNIKGYEIEPFAIITSQTCQTINGNTPTCL